MYVYCQVSSQILSVLVTQKFRSWRRSGSSSQFVNESSSDSSVLNAAKCHALPLRRGEYPTTESLPLEKHSKQELK